jgi:hypothetical protein
MIAGSVSKTKEVSDDELIARKKSMIKRAKDEAAQTIEAIDMMDEEKVNPVETA